MTYGAMIRTLRESLRMSRVEFAEKIGVSRSTIGEWENETSKPGEFNTQRLLYLASELDYKNGKG